MWPLPLATNNMSTIHLDMDHDMKVKISAVPDGIYFQYRPLSVMECIHPEPQRIQRGGGEGGVGG